ncbi:MAG: hypothetical protein EOO20_20410 [Chryseobacterium sp.]|nr:MAG: hypothetical protein EOO20_20410 [Chryseobacterium sp.]
MFKIICLICFTTVTICAQNSTVNWLNKNAHPLSAGLSSDSLKDIQFLTGLLGSKSIIGLGEASHGTREFYHQKGRIVKYLVQELNYRMLAFEATSEKVALLNKYIQEGSGDLKTILKAMGLYNSREMYHLCIWLMHFNKTRQDKVELTGIDREEFWADPLTRDQSMAETFIEKHEERKSKAIIWSHNLHIAKDSIMSGYKAMGYHMNQKFGTSYYAIGFDTYKGSVHVLNNGGELEKHYFEGIEGTFSDLFSKSRYTMFFIDCTTPGNPLTGKVNKITNLYSNWQPPIPLPVKPGADFDALIFIRGRK